MSNMYEIVSTSTQRSTPSVEPGTTERAITYLAKTERIIFFIIFLIILIVAFFGNIAAIIATAKRKHRYFQKTCVISLAITDLITAIVYCINHMETMSHSYVNWTLGKDMCSLVPTVQIFSVTASSITLVVIAVDRYRNVIHAFSKLWNPTPMFCIGGIAFIWICCAALAYPMWDIYEYKKLTVMFGNTSAAEVPTKKVFYFCVCIRKNDLMIYYCGMILIIFFPLFVTFLYLYYKIALLIWKHRKPLSSVFQKKENSSVNETSTTQVKSIENIKANNDLQIKSIMAKNKSIHVERKIRTFKIIVLLMVVFIICKLPYWIFNIMKLVTTKYNQPIHWVIAFSLYGLGLLSCALNPFLYTFLNPTCTFLSKISDFICKICCCCCSNAEFEEFEREYPFMIDNKKLSLKRNENLHCQKQGNRVKFEECPVVQVYSNQPSGSTSSNNFKKH